MPSEFSWGSSDGIFKVLQVDNSAAAAKRASNDESSEDLVCAKGEISRLHQCARDREPRYSGLARLRAHSPCWCN